MAGSYVIESTSERFDDDVVKRSHETPVVVDFWAAWCQPCRRLAPLLEKLAEEFAGAFWLVKADVDQLPQQAAAFGVQGIPAVYAMRDGRIVDSFSGLLTEPQLREWLQSILPTESDKVLKQALHAEENDPLAAEALFRQAIMLAPQSAEAKLGLARVLLAANDVEAAAAVLEELEARGFLEPEAQKLQAELQLRSHRLSSDDLSTLEAAAAAAPSNLQTKLQWAEALLAAGQYEPGLQTCLEIVEQGSGDLRDAARARMVDTFRVLGGESQLTNSFRRQLTLALY